MLRHRVVVTGLGALTALGRDVPTVWRRLLAGDNGIRRISYFDASQYACRVAAELGDEPPGEWGVEAVPPEYCRRGARLFLHAAREAYADAGLGGAALPAHRVGVAAGTTVNYVNARLAWQHFRFRRKEPPHLDLARLAREGEQPVKLFYRRQGEMASVLAAKALGLAGPNLSIDTACAASAYAVGEAFRMLRRGRVDAMIAGGACSVVSPIGILAFAVLGALSTNPDPEEASRPFDRRRDGFVMGEGAGAVVLERLESARARGARVYGEVAGYGATLNAGSLTDPSPDGASEEWAMRLALREAALSPEEVDYVAAHGTSTPRNDAVETKALRRVFGRHAGRLLVSSNKGQIGHTISAAGVCNLICALKAVEQGWVPPTAHYREPDPECDLDYVPNVGRQAAVQGALVNAFGFGGQNAVLAVRAA
jgi:3-oxoacyl-[acyl-carrier-protein] synthase II